MKLNKLFGLGALIFLSGCSAPKAKNLETISGLPVSVAQDNKYLSAVVYKDGKFITATNYWFGFNSDIIDATALIQSEINDGDEEKIELYGEKDEKERFQIYRLKVNGNIINFR